ncbi:MAG: zinc-ribbon domain-containing protein, partial [bacterium]|nr:zinc-ribbon domain-containing protein [bacterium]
MYCSFCGLKVPNESKFCEHCGRDLNTGQLKDSVQFSTNQIRIDNFENKKAFLIPSGAILS